MASDDSFATKRLLSVGDAGYAYYSLPELARRLGAPLLRLPFSLRVLLENLLRNEDGESVTRTEIAALAAWRPGSAEQEVSFHPARVLMPDSSGVPLLIDLAAMRDAMAERGLDPCLVNPQIPTDLVIDHSVQVDHAGSADALVKNMAIELERNRERYGAVRWAERQFRNLRVIPPGNGILHQINVECLASVVATGERGGVLHAFPDSLVGMDSHTTMVNGLGVFGWGVGGIEAATAQLGQPVGLLVPRVVGCRVTGAVRPGVCGTDIVLTLTELLRPVGLLGAIVEFFGPGLDALGVPDRATLANMAPEYGATMGFFPVDEQTLRFLKLTGRSDAQVALVKAYAQAQGLFRHTADPAPGYSEIVTFDLSQVEPVMAGPSRPEARVPLAEVPRSFRSAFAEGMAAAPVPPIAPAPAVEPASALQHGAVVIASITSCTNTSNPYQMIAAGLLARNALARGLRAHPAVKTSFSPGSRVVSGMLEAAGLLEPMSALGFAVVGYGCMSCGGGAGPLPPPVSDEITRRNLVTVGVLSSNRNFEGRLHPAVRGTYLASPPLVIAYAIAGSILRNLEDEPLGADRSGRPVFLRDLWPPDEDVRAVLGRAMTTELFINRYGELADGGPGWAALPHGNAPTFAWDATSEYLKRPPFLEGVAAALPPLADIHGARSLLMLGDNVTTDHISPGGNIPPTSAAGRYLLDHGVAPPAFNTYVARRANHEVMVRGTFANIRIRNELVPGREGGLTRHMPDGETMTVYDAAMAYARERVPLIVVAGRNYGCGSSRDWAAKGTRLLGVKAVLAESFERIHRSNLVGMGVIPLEFQDGANRGTLRLDGSESVDITGFADGFSPRMTVTALIRRPDGTTTRVPLLCRIDTLREATWMRHGGILPYVLRKFSAEERAAVEA